MHGSDIFVHSGYSNADCLISSVRRNSFVIVIMPLMLPSGDLISRLFVFNNAPAPLSRWPQLFRPFLCAYASRDNFMRDPNTDTPSLPSPQQRCQIHHPAAEFARYLPVGKTRKIRQFSGDVTPFQGCKVLDANNAFFFAKMCSGGFVSNF